ncbi:hypothetical protein [Nonomuraea sp. KM90]|uniref:hypothetical protein n=1 Tax=Nonomuraea sp. KM90 TaxID=3457428 RepID=UPI003FCDF1D1
MAALHAKVHRQRLDAAHKAALALVRHDDLIVHEDLLIVNMTRRAAAKPDGAGAHLPNGGNGQVRAQPFDPGRGLGSVPAGPVTRG